MVASILAFVPLSQQNLFSTMALQPLALRLVV